MRHVPLPPWSLDSRRTWLPRLPGPVAVAGRVNGPFPVWVFNGAQESEGLARRAACQRDLAALASTLQVPNGSFCASRCPRRAATLSCSLRKRSRTEDRLVADLFCGAFHPSQRNPQDMGLLCLSSRTAIRQGFDTCPMAEVCPVGSVDALLVGPGHHSPEEQSSGCALRAVGMMTGVRSSRGLKDIPSRSARTLVRHIASGSR